MRNALYLLAAAAAFGATADDQAIQKAEKSWSDAARHYDSKAFEQLLADDYVGVSITGKVIDKSALLHGVTGASATVKKKNAEVPEVPTEDLKIRIHGPVAIVTGSRTTTGENGLHIRFTRVWVKSGERWQLSAFQATRVQETVSKKKE